MTPKQFISTFGARLARDYEALSHTPHMPIVAEAYSVLKLELLRQYHSLPIEVEHVEHNPYRSSFEMFYDVDFNRRLQVLLTTDMPKEHPLGDSNCGTGLLYNDLFRAVHDYYGHYVGRFGFGPVGEENAFRAHARMFSPLAVRALATETRGQNNWVNFGPCSALPAEQRPYAEQKAGLLPAYAWEVE